eukprot:356906-Chlamydomonas_euryale.AAC.4
MDGWQTEGRGSVTGMGTKGERRMPAPCRGHGGAAKGTSLNADTSVDVVSGWVGVRSHSAQILGRRKGESASAFCAQPGVDDKGRKTATAFCAKPKVVEGALWQSASLPTS